MTWEELQVICLQKMFETQEDTLVVDDSTAAYIKMMPGVANEALSILATTGKMNRRTMVITQGQGEADTPPSFVAGDKNAYDLRLLCDDFYSMYRGEVTLEQGGTYGATRDYTMEGDSIVLLQKGAAGIWRVRYNAYHPRITKATPLNQKIEVDREAADMIALYMAGQLSKEDEMQRAQIYMNEFFVWLEELKAGYRRSNSPPKGNFTSSYGWY